MSDFDPDDPEFQNAAQQTSAPTPYDAVEQAELSSAPDEDAGTEEA